MRSSMPGLAMLGLISACGVTAEEHAALAARVERLEEALTHARNQSAELRERVDELTARPAAVAPTDSRIAAPVEIPVPAATASAVPTTTTRIELTPDGLFVDGLEVPDADFDAKLAELRAANPDISAVVAADDAAPMTDVVALLDRIKRAGIDKFAIAVAPEVLPSKPKPEPGSASTDLKDPFTR